ncbi:MAG: Trp family transcriptional regulator [bacterium]
MVKVNPRRITNTDRMKYLDLLWTSIATLKSRDEVKNFFKDLLSESESIMLSRRIMIAKYLLEGLTYDEIKVRLKVGDGNIAKIHDWLVSGLGGYEKAIKEFNETLDKRGVNKIPSSPLSFDWLRKKYPLHFLLFNLFLDEKSK